MKNLAVTKSYPRVSAILDSYADLLGGDRTAYQHHVYRVLNYYAALRGSDEIPEAVLIAAAFHDIGIWTDHTIDYLEPSARHAEDYLHHHQLAALQTEVREVIEYHHKLTPYEESHASTVEAYRRADLVDLSLGAIRFGLPADFVRSVKAALPNAGFHGRLVRLAAKQLLRRPWQPLPMIRW